MFYLRRAVLVAAFIFVGLVPIASAQSSFVRGDTDGDGQVQLNDATVILEYLFLGGTPLACADAADLNDDGSISLVDAVYSLSAMFVPGSPAPGAPYPGCGIDPSFDSLDCTGPLSGCPGVGDIDWVVSHSADDLEEVPGIGVGIAMGSLAFEERRLQMRPVRLEISPSVTSGLVEISGGGASMALYLLDGTPVSLPTAVNVIDLPIDFLIDATSPGSQVLRASLLGTPDEDVVTVRSVLAPGLAGRSLPSYPHFEFVDTFNEGEVESAIDPHRHGDRVGQEYRVYVVAHRSAAEWAIDPSLVDVSGGFEVETVVGGSTADNRIVPWATAIDDAALLGQRYDLVYDFGSDGQLDPGDLIDGFGSDAGFFVVRDLNSPGPYPVTATQYSGGSFLGQRTYYPANIDSLDQVPLVIISHGNGHNYVWYDYLQSHLASYGYVVMSHQNNTGPGIESASTTTLTNTDYIIANQSSIAGGVLDGHLDTSRIVWIGHSRGGEGVTRAYDRIFDGGWTPTNYALEDIVLVSSIAPTVYLGVTNSNTHETNYHLLAGAADGDVSGCPTSPSRLYFRLAQGAAGNTQQTYVWGASHNDFNCCGFSDGTGPAQIGRPSAQVVAKSYYLAIIDAYARDNPATREFFTRHYDSLRPSGIGGNVTVVNQYIDGDSVGNDVIEDYQSEPDATISSSGGAVLFDVANLVEDLFLDANNQFSWFSSDPMNAMTQADQPDDEESGVVFDWTVGDDRRYELEVVPSLSDFTDDVYLSFRACQGARHPETVGLGDTLHFSVTLRDGSGNESSLSTASYGRISVPYPRTGCGSGVGWANEFNTIRIRLTDFQADGVELDLGNIEAIAFRFGSTWGSARGRLGLDDVHLDRE